MTQDGALLCRVRPDAAYMSENIEKDLLPSVGLAHDPVGILQGYQWIKHIPAEGGQVFMAHDAEGYISTVTLHNFTSSS